MGLLAVELHLHLNGLALMLDRQRCVLRFLMHPECNLLRDLLRTLIRQRSLIGRALVKTGTAVPTALHACMRSPRAGMDSRCRRMRTLALRRINSTFSIAASLPLAHAM